MKPTRDQNASFFKALWNTAIPLAATNLMATLVNLADNLMVGQLGEKALGGVALANQMSFLLILGCFGIGSGAAVFTSQYWGQKDRAGVQRSQALALGGGLVLALIFWTLSQSVPEGVLAFYSPDLELQNLGAQYLKTVGWAFPLMAVSFSVSLVLRSVGATKLPFFMALGALLLNIFLNGIFIFGWWGFSPMGVVGAALATVISRGVEAVGLLLGSWWGRLPNVGPFKDYGRYPKGFLWAYLRTAGPVFVNEMVWSLGITTLQSIYAKLGSAATAAVAVLDMAVQVTFVIFMGTGSAAAILVGHAIGGGREDQAREYARQFARWAPWGGALVALWLIPGAILLPQAFNLSPEGYQNAVAVLWILALSMPFKSYMHHLIIGVFRGGGDTTFALLMDLLGLWGVAVPLALLGTFVFHWPLPGIYALVALEELVKSLFSWYRLKSGRWYHKVVAEPMVIEHPPLP